MQIHLASAPVSWGVIHKDMPSAPPWSKTLDEIQLAGYQGTELGPIGYLPLDKQRLKAELDRRGLQLLSAFVPVYLIDPRQRPEEYEEALTVMRLLGEMGCEFLTLADALFADPLRTTRAGRVRPEDELDPRRWKSFVRHTNEMGKMALEEFGLRAVYHPHVGCFVESPREVDRLMADTDPRYVNLCLDTAHAMYGGDDPIDLARRWSSRIPYMHLKECDKRKLEQQVHPNGWDYMKAVEVGVFPELGHGSVDFPALLAVLAQNGYSGWAVVEQDILPDSGASPLESAKRNLNYLRQAGFAPSK